MGHNEKGSDTLRYRREEVIRKGKAEREIKGQLTALEVQARSKQFENDEMPLPQEAWDAEPQELAGD